MIVYELDGTLFDWCPSSGPEVHESLSAIFSDPDRLREAVRPKREVCQLVVSLHEAGFTEQVAYLTGRTVDMEDVTSEHLAEADLPEGVVYLQSSWKGWHAYVDYKTWVLEGLRARAEIDPGGRVLYVGDRSEDRTAAQRAGVVYLDAAALEVLAGYEPQATKRLRVHGRPTPHGPAEPCTRRA